MTRSLALSITTPFEVLTDELSILSLRAEDASGSFGVLPGHVDLLTVLPVSVVRWRHEKGEVGYCALRGGVLTVSNGNHIAIACRQGVVGDDLETLSNDVAAFQEEELDRERLARTAAMRMHARAVRQLVSYLAPKTAFADEAGYGDGQP